MKILIVEDDYFKFSKISTILGDVFGCQELIHYDNVHGAINYIKNDTPDLIVLDMSLPSHPAVAGEGSPVSMPSGGIEIILEIKRLRKRNTPIVIVTQYPDVEVEYEYYSIEESGAVISDLYGMMDLSVVHYDHESDDWIYKIKNILRRYEIPAN